MTENTDGAALLFIDSPFTLGAYPCQRPGLRLAPITERAEYLDRLYAAAEELPDRLAGRKIAAIRVGGTATVLPCDGLARLLLGLRRAFCTEDAEITLTAEPPTVTSPCLSALAASGYTRLELSALSLSERFLKAQGAPWDAETVEDALSMLADYACPDAAAKLWCGLPGQTEGMLRDALFTCAALPGMDRIYLLRPENGGEAAYRFCAAWLTKNGYSEYLPRRFARAGEDRWHTLRRAGVPVLPLLRTN